MKRYQWIFASFFILLVLPSIWASDAISLRDKIGQMLILGFDESVVNRDAPIVKAIMDDNLGGVILYDFNYNNNTFNRNIHSVSQVKKLNRQLQQYAKTGDKKYHRPSMPLIIGVDYEGGYANRLDERYGFPPTPSAKRFAGLTPKEAEAVSAQMADTLRASGFNLNFAPVLDLNTNPKSPIIGQLDRSYSAKPERVAKLAEIVSQALTQANVISVCKHYPGHGSAKADSHQGFVDVTAIWDEIELQPFKTGIQSKSMCPIIMTAHIVNKRLDPSGMPATLSKKMLTDVLREQLGFDGVIMTDDLQMKAIRHHYGLDEALVKAINAGADMLIFANHTKKNAVTAKAIIDMVEREVKKGKIKRTRIDDAYKRIMLLKAHIAIN